MSGPSDYAQNVFAITPSDTVVFTTFPNANGQVITKALYVGSGGDVAITTQGGGTVTLKNVPSGALLPISVTQIRSTNTTASNIMGLA